MRKRLRVHIAFILICMVAMGCEPSRPPRPEIKELLGKVNKVSFYYAVDYRDANDPGITKKATIITPEATFNPKLFAGFEVLSVPPKASLPDETPWQVWVR